MDEAAEWPFVGRAEEQERIRFLLGGRPPMGIVLVGGQGVGKTRLAAWARDHAVQKGFEVRHAVAGASTAAIPFGALATHLPVLREVADTPQAALQAAARHLIDLAGPGQLLLSIDDAQHLDQASIGLLQQITPSPFVAVLLTVRSGREPLRALVRAGLAERIDLDPLGPADVEQLLVAALDGPVSPSTVDMLNQASRGNPLYLRELVLGSRRQDTLQRSDGLWHLREPVASPHLADVIEERLVGLDPDERRALELVAVAGTLGYQTLVQLAGEAAVEGVEREGLVTVSIEDRRHIVGISHPVHADVVRAALTTRRSLQLNRQVADALEASGARRRDDVLRIAVSRLEAGGEVSAPLVTEAARRALAADDLVLGERLARLAYGAGGGLSAGLDLGGALTRLGRPHEAVEVFESIDLDGAEDRDRALVAMEWAECLFWGLGDPVGARAVLDGALATVGAPEWRDQIVVTAAAYALLEGRPGDALTAVDRIHEAGAPRGVTASGLTVAPALALSGRGEDALTAVERALSARDAMADDIGLVHVGMLLMARTVALTELGRVADATELGEAGHAAAVDAGVEYAQAWFAMTTGRAHLLAGGLDEADRWFREAAARYDELAMPGNRRWCLYGSAWALALDGTIDLAQRKLEQARAIGPSHVRLMEPETRRAEAAVALADGDRAGAERRLVEGADLGAAMGLLTQELGALHDLVRMGVLSRVDRLVELAAGVDGALAVTCAGHGLALRDDDAEGLGRTCEAFAALGAVLLAAEAAAHAASAHRAQGNRREATSWSSRSFALVGPDDGRGSPSLLQRSERVALTEREREVAHLAAIGGLRSKDIAARLGLSRRTVDNHLHRAYTKLGVDGREALAEALTRGR